MIKHETWTFDLTHICQFGICWSLSGGVRGEAGFCQHCQPGYYHCDKPCWTVMSAHQCCCMLCSHKMIYYPHGCKDCWPNFRRWPYNLRYVPNYRRTRFSPILAASLATNQGLNQLQHRSGNKEVLHRQTVLLLVSSQSSLVTQLRTSCIVVTPY